MAAGYRELLNAYDENAVRDALKEWKQFHPRTFEETVSKICGLIAEARPKPFTYPNNNETGTINSQVSVKYESWV